MRQSIRQLWKLLPEICFFKIKHTAWLTMFGNCIWFSWPDYILDPVEKSWAIQLNKEHEQKRKWQRKVKTKVDCCTKWKANLQLAHVNEGKAQLYGHGKAFNTSTGDEVVEDDTD